MEKKKQIVIVTEEFDPHTDVVVVTLREMGYQPVRVHTADFPLKEQLSFHIGTQDAEAAWQGWVGAHGERVDIDTIRSIWWRRPAPFMFPETWASHERDFAHNEFDHALRGMWATRDCYWMSFPQHIRGASYKVEQLQRAAASGFDIPRTLVTSESAEARAFYDVCHGKMIYKTLSQPMFQPNQQGPLHAIYTTPITDAHFEQFDETIGQSPCLFQEYVPKQLELRVTIIGDDIFTAAIHSQHHERTQYDWRHYEVDIPYTQFDLPVTIAEQCHKLVKSYQLNYSAMDFILTPDGQYVFIENNPNGQWYFLQEAIPEMKMKEALASYLIRGNSAE